MRTHHLDSAAKMRRNAKENFTHALLYGMEEADEQDDYAKLSEKGITKDSSFDNKLKYC